MFLCKFVVGLQPGGPIIMLGFKIFITTDTGSFVFVVMVLFIYFKTRYHGIEAQIQNNIDRDPVALQLWYLIL